MVKSQANQNLHEQKRKKKQILSIGRKINKGRNYMKILEVRPG